MLCLQGSRSGRSPSSWTAPAGDGARRAGGSAAAPPAGGRHRTAGPDRAASGGGDDGRRVEGQVTWTTRAAAYDISTSSAVP